MNLIFSKVFDVVVIMLYPIWIETSHIKCCKIMVNDLITVGAIENFADKTHRTHGTRRII